MKISLACFRPHFRHPTKFSKRYWLWNKGTQKCWNANKCPSLWLIPAPLYGRIQSYFTSSIHLTDPRCWPWHSSRWKPEDGEDSWKIWVFPFSRVRSFWLHAPLINFHRNEWGPASNALSSSFHTSMVAHKNCKLCDISESGWSHDKAFLPDPLVCAPF